MNKASPAFDEKRGERKSGRVEEVRACTKDGNEDDRQDWIGFDLRERGRAARRR